MMTPHHIINSLIKEHLWQVWYGMLSSTHCMFFILIENIRWPPQLAIVYP
jgi:hypothetical protein